MRALLGYGLGAAALVLGGCSDPKTASEGNFAKAIDAYFAENPACIGAPRGGVTPAGQEENKAPYPAYMLEKPLLDFGGGKQLDALVGAGLLKMKAGTVPVASFGGNKDTAVRIYELTEAGAKAFSMKDPANRFRRGFVTARRKWIR